MATMAKRRKFFEFGVSWSGSILSTLKTKEYFENLSKYDDTLDIDDWGIYIVEHEEITDWSSTGWKDISKTKLTEKEILEYVKTEKESGKYRTFENE